LDDFSRQVKRRLEDRVVFVAGRRARCIQQVEMHELCRVVHHDHGREFHAFLERVIPDWQARKTLLEIQLL